MTYFSQCQFSLTFPLPWRSFFLPLATWAVLVKKKKAFCHRVSDNTWHLINMQSHSQRPRFFWLEDGNRDLWPGPIPEVCDSQTSCHSAHAQSQAGQIWLVLVSIYCVYIAIQNWNVVRPGQGSRFPAHDKRDPWGRGW